MGLTQVGGALLILLLCPLLGALPLTGWITRLVSGQNLAAVGTGNVGVSAAFYHGGKVAGILSATAEAGKGIAAVLLARAFFPTAPTWEIMALMALVMGRFWFAKGAGTTNVVWGFVVHDWAVALLTWIISGIGFTIMRQRQQGRLLVLVLLPLLTALRHPDDGARIAAVACLSGLIAWIYHKLPDDLDLPPQQGRLESQKMFRFFRGDRALVSLDRPLVATEVGPKAAALSQLRTWGYPVPQGYVLKPGDDPAPLLAILTLSPTQPVVVRSSALDEDTAGASAAGIYQSFLNLGTSEQVAAAIHRCFASYHAPAAGAYRQSMNLPEQGMAVLVQTQVQGQFSGVAFSRDPVARCGDAVLIEALPGGAEGVVSGQVTPASYRVLVQADDVPPPPPSGPDDSWRLPAALSLTVEGEGPVPSAVLQQVAYLARHLERRYQGVPQDIEWSFDGDQLWLLQCRPITTLQPLWTRKIAAEVIPGAIRPLTWSINRPLTCGVWGDIFTIVLGQRAAGLDFAATATLHRAHAYFNATLLGEIFRRMGLPPESLEFLTRGAKFSRPPLTATLRNLPGLLRLAQRELGLAQDYDIDEATLFAPSLTSLGLIKRQSLPPEDLLERIDDVLALLRRVTYYNIFAPLSFALRRAVLRVPETDLDPSANAEIAALTDLRAIADDTRLLLSNQQLASISNASSLMATLAECEDGQTILARLHQFIDRYGYLSEVGTDIAVPTWQENPRPVRELLAQFVLHPPPAVAQVQDRGGAERVQRRLALKGRVNTLYNQLLAELRWTILALEAHWLAAGHLQQAGDIFFLTLEELQATSSEAPPTWTALNQRIAARRDQFDHDCQQPQVPYLVYGNAPPTAPLAPPSPAQVSQVLSGIGASAGVIEGQVQVVTTLDMALASPEGDEGLILVVPYTDAGWSPLLAQAQGLIANVGGRLSHGAIIAREYGIPAVMDVTDATQRLHTGQRVRVDGQAGTVQVLAELA